ncbi:MAG: SpoIIIAH-like family protein [Clostridiales bacterium]|nr:SpoIIIAH-like family protein [Clostridiales bacterium]
MFKISRKAIVISAMVVLLLVTGLLNWKYIANSNNDGSAVTDNKQEQDIETASFFSTYKNERMANREEEMTYLDSVIANANTDTETINEAQQMKMEIVANMELESTLEGLLVAKGFEDAIVTFGSTSVNVVIKDAELTSAKVAQILDVVTTETQYTASEVKVIQAE